MNKQGLNGISWTNYTWNPITGCLNNCFYCYGRKIYQRFNKSFKPEIHHDRLAQPCKVDKPSKIFTCSISDLWGKSVPPLWRAEVWNIMYACPQHTFQVLTKQPQNITDLDFQQLPQNLWLGVTVTGISDEWRYGYLKEYKGIKFVSYEPLLNPIGTYLKEVNWIIVGAMTGQGTQNFIPKKEWVQRIIDYARKYKISLFLKNNLQWPEKIQQFPKVKE